MTSASKILTFEYQKIHAVNFKDLPREWELREREQEIYWQESGAVTPDVINVGLSIKKTSQHTHSGCLEHALEMAHNRHCIQVYRDGH